MLSTHALYSFNVEVPSKIALLAGADSPSKFLWFKIDLPLTSYFFYFFHFSWLSLFPHRPPRAFFFLLLSWKAFRLPLLLSFPSFFLYFQCFSGFFPFFFWKSGTTKERLFCFVSGSLFFCLKRKREKKQRGTGLMSCPLCFWKAEKGAFCSRWDNEDDAVWMGTKQSGIIQSLILL